MLLRSWVVNLKKNFSNVEIADLKQCVDDYDKSKGSFLVTTGGKEFIEFKQFCESKVSSYG